MPGYMHLLLSGYALTFASVVALQQWKQSLRRTHVVPELFVTGSHPRVLLLASKMRNLEVRDQRDTAPNGAAYFGRRLDHRTSTIAIPSKVQWHGSSLDLIGTTTGLVA